MYSSETESAAAELKAALAIWQDDGQPPTQNEQEVASCAWALLDSLGLSS